MNFDQFYKHFKVLDTKLLGLFEFKYILRKSKNFVLLF